MSEPKPDDYPMTKEEGDAIEHKIQSLLKGEKPTTEELIRELNYAGRKGEGQIFLDAADRLDQLQALEDSPEMPCGHIDIYLTMDERGLHCSRCERIYTDWVGMPDKIAQLEAENKALEEKLESLHRTNDMTDALGYAAQGTIYQRNKNLTTENAALKLKIDDVEEILKNTVDILKGVDGKDSKHGRALLYRCMNLALKQLEQTPIPAADLEGER